MSTKWSLDASHSEVIFKVKHMVISTVTGHFDKFHGDVIAEDEQFKDAKFNFGIEVNSINTKNSDRDAHLKSEDFFAAESFPQILFSSENGIENGKLSGTIEVRGVKKEITLDVDFGGVIVDPYGNNRAGFEFSGSINRKEFGLNWSQTTEAGGLIVSDVVKLTVNLEFVQA